MHREDEGGSQREQAAAVACGCRYVPPARVGHCFPAAPRAPISSLGMILQGLDGRHPPKAAQPLGGTPSLRFESFGLLPTLL